MISVSFWHGKYVLLTLGGNVKLEITSWKAQNIFGKIVRYMAGPTCVQVLLGQSSLRPGASPNELFFLHSFPSTTGTSHPPFSPPCPRPRRGSSIICSWGWVEGCCTSQGSV